MRENRAVFNRGRAGFRALFAERFWVLKNIPPDRTVLIAGPTASGKSALALEIAETGGGVIVNADALQVFDAWPILSAQPPQEDRARAPHMLYGHLPHNASYSVGDWLREVAPLIEGPERVIIVGGTGLYFTALTEGLAEIPATPPEVRKDADAFLATRGLTEMVTDLDDLTRNKIDIQNPARVQRAWEVLQSTGRGLAEWQADTPTPLLAPNQAEALLIDAPKDWLNPRIEQRFDHMLATGALEEAERELSRWNPAHQSSKAIGAAELIKHLKGEIPLKAAREAAVIATRQYAKRQRTWFKARMKGWKRIAPNPLSSDT